MTKDSKEPTGSMAPVKMAPSEVVFTRTQEKQPSAQREAGGAFLVLGHRELRALSPTERTTAAAWAGVPESTVERLIERDLPLVFASGHPRAMQQRADEVRRESHLPVRSVRRAGCAPWGIALIAFTCVPVALIAAWFILFPLFIAFAMVLLATGTSSAVWAALASRGGKRLEEGKLALEQALGTSPAPELTEARARLCALRRQWADSNLPTSVSADLRAAMREVDDEIEALGRAAVGQDESARNRARQHLVEVHGRLSEVGAILGGISAGVASADGASTGAVDALARSARLARDALSVRL